jgi:hypothetical protein
MSKDDIEVYLIMVVIFGLIIFTPYLAMSLYNIVNPVGFVTGHGVSTDTIYGVELDGIVWKTYSVYLTNDQQMKDPPIYSVDGTNKTLLNRIQEYANNGQKVHIYYMNVVLNAPWDYTSGIIVTDVEPVNGST